MVGARSVAVAIALVFIVPALAYVLPSGMILDLRDAVLARPPSPYAAKIAMCPSFTISQLRLITAHAFAAAGSVLAALVVIFTYVSSALNAKVTGPRASPSSFDWAVRGIVVLMVLVPFYFAFPRQDPDLVRPGCGGEFIRVFRFWLFLFGYAALFTLARLTARAAKRI